VTYTIIFAGENYVFWWIKISQITLFGYTKPINSYKMTFTDVDNHIKETLKMGSNKVAIYKIINWIFFHKSQHTKNVCDLWTQVLFKSLNTMKKNGCAVLELQ
jgi:hypothetical protein